MNKKLHKIGGLATALLMATTILVPANASAQTTTNQCSSLVRDLTLGSTGSDVVALQTFLETKGYMTMPVGVSKGYFGGLTKSAVAKYQAANAIAPAVGYFGPLTRGKLVSACATTSTPGNGNNNGNNGGLNGGEASLEKFDLSNGDDSDVEEGATAEVAEIEFDVEDGDILIDRIDLRLVADNTNDEKDPWDTFETLRLLVDGKEIAEVDLSDEDEYLNDDEGTIRLSDIDFKIDEGDTAKIVVEIEAQNNVDGADNNLSSWTINVEDDGIRATDAEGIQQYVGSDSDVVNFDVAVKGDGEELNVKSSSEDPGSTNLKVENDEKSDMYDIFAFKLEADESDIEIDTVQVTLDSNVAVSNLVSDLVLEIDGEEYDDWAFVGTGTTTRVVEFDIDKDFTLDEGDTVDVVLRAEFKAANGTNYNYGATIKGSIASGAIEGEGADDLTSDGSATGKVHTLAASTADITNVSWSTSKTDSTGVIDFFFTVTAEDDDFDVLGSEILDEVNGTFTNATGVVSASGKGQLSRVSGDSVTAITGGYQVNEGDTTKFRVRYSVSTPGSAEVTIDSVAGQEVEDDDQLSPTVILE